MVENLVGKLLVRLGDGELGVHLLEDEWGCRGEWRRGRMYNRGAKEMLLIKEELH
jgi:hypothetical protein